MCAKIWVSNPAEKSSSRIREAQETIRRYIKPGVSLVDELIAERREAAKHE